MLRKRGCVSLPVQPHRHAAQEVSAHSDETFDISEKNMDTVSQAVELAENLSRQAQSLRSSEQE